MYRPNVCVFIANERGEFLGCQRIKSEHFQCVQGGIEKSDNDILVAAQREVLEEIGLKPEDLVFVGEILPPSGDPKEFRYELKPDANLRRFGYRGQQQRVVLFFTKSTNINRIVLVPPKELHALQEFKSVQWMQYEELQTRVLPNKAHIFELVGKAAPQMMKTFLEQHHL